LLANRLRQLLPWDGSIEYSMTWSRRDTPHGRVYYQLAALARRTSGQGCSGWPTPAHSDQFKVRFKKESILRDVFGRGVNCIARKTIEEYGEFPHPDLYAWLMGFPMTWNRAMPTVWPGTATPSCPRLQRRFFGRCFDDHPPPPSPPLPLAALLHRCMPLLR
jgi:hypothetical protein